MPPTNCCYLLAIARIPGLPVEVRDSFIAKNSTEVAIKPAESRVGREYQAMQLHERGDDGAMTNQKLHEGLMRIARKTPYYERNLPQLCSFFARGECTRGTECPYRHEMPRDKDDPLSKQNIKDRYAGHDDPVAAKIMARAAAAPVLREPADHDAKTLWLGNLDETIGSEDVRYVCVSV
jgi:pre-mRNA-splicing factor RBM22/SLT11